MSEKFVAGTILLLCGAFLGFEIRQALINRKLEQENALQKVQIEELEKKVRLTAQDVGFLEQLVIEGKQ